MRRIPKVHQAAGLFLSVLLSSVCFAGAHYAHDQKPVLPPLAKPAQSVEVHRAESFDTMLFAQVASVEMPPKTPGTPSMPAMPDIPIPPPIPAMPAIPEKAEIIVKGILPPTTAVLEISGQTQIVRLGKETSAGRVEQIGEDNVTIGGRTIFFQKGVSP